VDAAVIQACDALGAKVTVYGAHNQLRHQTKTGRNIALGGSYRMRDAWMVEQGPDVVVGLWNGHSAGTLATVKHAKRQGIEAYLVR
jgi:membrane carboxypeptidase/penicillin-binding protein PbpC